MQQRAFCVKAYVKNVHSIIRVQRAFRLKFNIAPAVVFPIEIEFLSECIREYWKRVVNQKGVSEQPRDCHGLSRFPSLLISLRGDLNWSACFPDSALYIFFSVGIGQIQRL